jgi:hypothetical protein
VSAASPQSTFSNSDGLEVIDLRDNAEFAARRLHARDVAVQMLAMERLARAFVEKPDTVLQELVNVAVELCGADSAGISLEQDQGTDSNFYHWVRNGRTIQRVSRCPAATLSQRLRYNTAAWLSSAVPGA